MKQNLRRASQELFRRRPDERFSTLQSLFDYCFARKNSSVDRWHGPTTIEPRGEPEQLLFSLGSDGEFLLNDWSFSQVCKLSGVAKDTLNRLTPETAARVIEETMPRGNKPLQFLTQDQTVRSIHGTQYTRLWNADLLAVVREFATDFVPPQEGNNGATGLYAGEQDMFVFLIDPGGWAEINGEAICPGFFLWNSEVGKRSLGIQTFWFQKICGNHLVWDAVEVVEFKRKHTANVHESLGDIRRIIEGLTKRRDERKDGFAARIRKAMQTTLGKDAEEVEKLLAKEGIARSASKRAIEIAGRHRPFTLWSLIDALTRIAAEEENAGDRTEADAKASSLLALAT